MRKRFLMMVMAVGLLLSFNFLSARAQTSARPGSGDDETPRYEIGGQLFSFHGHDLGFGWGAGGRFSYNLNDWVALDNEINFFLPDEGPPYATQGLFGVKVGKRIKKKVGVFLKVRPGFQTNFYVNGQDEARFLIDVGGVAEIYPNRHIVLRFDAGDVIIPFSNQMVDTGLGTPRLGTTHNLQYNFGVGLRF